VDPRSRRGLQDFGLSSGLAAAIAAAFLSWEGAGRSAAIAALAGGLLLAGAVLLPEALVPVARISTRTAALWRGTCEALARGLEILLGLPGPGGPV
jgi:hypothetical protein